ncbi:MAG TPA: hypothetical protein ENN23_02705 [Deltaproteobacteria bacterium]|nr:hypothetical protein [Deltaproteobacteria bacterium]
MNKNMKYLILIITLFNMAALTGCAGFGTIIQKHEVAEIPEITYERIIRLYNPDGVPDKTLAGVVFVKAGANVCTDFPREVIITSLAELEGQERQIYEYYEKYAIKPADEILGYIAIAYEYRINIWENLKDENCQYKVQIVYPETVRGTSGAGTGGYGGGGGF